MEGGAVARVPTRAWQFLVKGERSIFRDNLSLPGPSFGSVAKCKNVAAAAGASTVLQLPASGTCVTQKDEWGRPTQILIGHIVACVLGAVAGLGEPLNPRVPPPA